MELRQVELYDAESEATMLCWLAVDPRIKRRAIVTLKGLPSRSWVVIRVYNTVRDESEIHRRWQVGGLDARHV